MKNVTITLDEQVAEWARQQAAGKGMSVSRFIGELLQRTMQESRAYEAAMQRYRSKEPAKLKSSRRSYPSRDELHER